MRSICQTDREIKSQIHLEDLVMVSMNSKAKKKKKQAFNNRQTTAL